MAVHGALVEVVSIRPERFLPYIQPYEFEALLFSDPGSFANIEPEWQIATKALAKVRKAVQSPEHINDGATTHPSARLTKLLPGYRIVAHGSRIAAQIGIERIRAECRHFNRWLESLEGLTATKPDP